MKIRMATLHIVFDDVEVPHICQHCGNRFDNSLFDNRMLIRGLGETEKIAFIKKKDGKYETHIVGSSLINDNSKDMIITTIECGKCCEVVAGADYSEQFGTKESLEEVIKKLEL